MFQTFQLMLNFPRPILPRLIWIAKAMLRTTGDVPDLAVTEGVLLQQSCAFTCAVVSQFLTSKIQPTS
jgi:hypothetical protein